MWICYNILFTIGYTLLLPHFLLRMIRRGGYRKNFGERFGIYGGDKLEQLGAGSRYWIHAVSVGEAQLALSLVQELVLQEPGLQFVLSTTTSTGYAFLMERKRPEDVLVYYPLDFPWVVARVLKRLRPRALFLMECELWPNLLRRLASCSIPVWVVNGRISEHSYAGYRKVRWIFWRVARFVTGFLVQTDGDAERLRALGAERVRVLGSAKFDVPLPDASAVERARTIVQSAGMDPGGLFWVLGSTWPGEEGALLDLYLELREEYPTLQLIVVPRHAERGDEVERLLQGRGLAYMRRANMVSGGGTPGGRGTCILLADTTGELAGYYALADLVFVGKSLAGNHGGQNPVEPAALGKAVITGINMENFSGVMSDLVSRDALLVADDFAKVASHCRALLGDSGYRARLGASARAAVDDRRGVMRRSARILLGKETESER